jgi:hypothetical protein
MASGFDLRRLRRIDADTRLCLLFPLRFLDIHGRFLTILGFLGYHRGKDRHFKPRSENKLLSAFSPLTFRF